ncbi:hypothetical protein B0H17DRAFT_1131086 [Mycena rosella]|uniref:Uncharacterized protein n=1 Tax=Mycena rosella TaxID=1033263 RepID=A0AAD7DPV5_MYCRO|nr:hypothetical protein B0H17DRAFT_1131086 [Mycena rosella]
MFALRFVGRAIYIRAVPYSDHEDCRIKQDHTRAGAEAMFRIGDGCLGNPDVLVLRAARARTVCATGRWGTTRYAPKPGGAQKGGRTKDVTRWGVLLYEMPQTFGCDLCAFFLKLRLTLTARITPGGLGYRDSGDGSALTCLMTPKFSASL